MHYPIEIAERLKIASRGGGGEDQVSVGLCPELLKSSPILENTAAAAERSPTIAGSILDRVSFHLFRTSVPAIGVPMRHSSRCECHHGKSQCSLATNLAVFTLYRS
jgi:hypothetical protein